ncbi:hypothetical protein ABI59_15595 [Acidobacteria bacterium Mor1]|nr:hypothetical protein ABI59_15595 [Acidobacteria bacterium Mor1]
MSPGPQKQFDRAQALERALEVFWKQGFEATGMADLTREMGIGRQSLYDTFGGKKQLFHEALNAYFCGVMGPVIAQLHAPGSALENMRKVLGIWHQRLETMGERGCMVGNATAQMDPSDTELAKCLNQYFGTLEDAFTKAFEKAREQKEIRDDVDPRVAARLVLHTGQGLVLLHKLRPDPANAQKVMESVFQLIQRD